MYWSFPGHLHAKHLMFGVFLGVLRLDLSKLSEKQRRYCMANAQRHIDANLLILNENHLALTKDGLFVSDMVMSDLIMI